MVEYIGSESWKTFVVSNEYDVKGGVIQIPQFTNKFGVCFINGIIMNILNSDKLCEMFSSINKISLEDDTVITSFSQLISAKNIDKVFSINYMCKCLIGSIVSVFGKMNIDEIAYRISFIYNLSSFESELDELKRAKTKSISYGDIISKSKNYHIAQYKHKIIKDIVALLDDEFETYKSIYRKLKKSTGSSFYNVLPSNNIIRTKFSTFNYDSIMNELHDKNESDVFVIVEDDTYIDINALYPEEIIQISNIFKSAITTYNGYICTDMILNAYIFGNTYPNHVVYYDVITNSLQNNQNICFVPFYKLYYDPTKIGSSFEFYLNMKTLDKEHINSGFIGFKHDTLYGFVPHVFHYQKAEFDTEFIKSCGFIEYVSDSSISGGKRREKYLKDTPTPLEYIRPVFKNRVELLGKFKADVKHVSENESVAEIAFDEDKLHDILTEYLNLETRRRHFDPRVSPDKMEKYRSTIARIFDFDAL